MMLKLRYYGFDLYLFRRFTFSRKISKYWKERVIIMQVEMEFDYNVFLRSLDKKRVI